MTSLRAVWNRIVAQRLHIWKRSLEAVVGNVCDNAASYGAV